MKINFANKFKNFNGDTLKDGESKKELSLRDVCVDSLLAVDKRETLDSEEKLKRYSLALGIFNGKKDSLSAEDIVLLKELIGKYYSTLIVGQALPMLDSD